MTQREIINQLSMQVVTLNKYLREAQENISILESIIEMKEIEEQRDYEEIRPYFQEEINKPNPDTITTTGTKYNHGTETSVLDYTTKWKEETNKDCKPWPPLNGINENIRPRPFIGVK